MVALIAILFSLCGMFFQDIKSRHIHIILPPIVFLGGAYLLLQNLSWNKSVEIIAYNLIFLFLTFFILIIYMSLKNRTFQNPFKNYFGLGDLLFYLAVSPLFVLHNYILFFILSMIFSIVLFFIFKKFLKKDSIPLAGYASLLLLILICKDMLFNYPGITLINL
ncbi:hypothetical protein D3C87_419950 [compost metagenome]